MGDRARAIGLTLAACCAGCYHPEPLAPGALLIQLRGADRLPPPLAGDGPTGAVGTLTEARSVALALTWNRDLQAFRLTRGVAEGEVVTAGRLANPVLRAELTHLQEADVQAFGWQLRLSWQPPQPGVRGGRTGAARAHADEIEHEIAEREWMLACDVRVAHAEALAIDAELQVATETITNRRRLAGLVDQRIAGGGTTLLDRDLARLSLVTAERAESELQLARTVAANTLVQLLGVGPLTGRMALDGTLEDAAPDAPLPAAAELEERALAARPALAAAVSRYRASEETLRAETAARWPWFAFSAAPNVRRNEFVGAATDVSFGVDLLLPILDTNIGNVKSATAARQLARAQTLAALADVRSAIARALATVAQERALLRRLEADIVPLLAGHERSLALALRAAELDLSTLVRSEELMLRARTDVITARLGLRRGEIALERAIGAHIF